MRLSTSDVYAIRDAWSTGRRSLAETAMDLRVLIGDRAAGSPIEGALRSLWWDIEVPSAVALAEGRGDAELTADERQAIEDAFDAIEVVIISAS
jgi:hypothetical protein